MKTFQCSRSSRNICSCVDLYTCRCRLLQDVLNDYSVNICLYVHHTYAFGDWKRVSDPLKLEFSD